MKALFGFFILIISLASQATTISEGSYIGNDAKRAKFSLHLQSYPGRDGSFLGILTTGSAARIYLFDSFSTGKYGLVPMRAMDNYVIGVTGTTPIMALTVTADSMVITPNHSQVDIAFNTSITFKRSTKKSLAWTDLKAGNHGRGKMLISNIDVNNEATVTSRVSGFSGDYVLRETRPKLYVLLESQLNPTGVRLSKDVKNIVFFISGEMKIMNSSTGNVTEL